MKKKVNDFQTYRHRYMRQCEVNRIKEYVEMSSTATHVHM